MLTLRTTDVAKRCYHRSTQGLLNSERSELVDGVEAIKTTLDLVREYLDTALEGTEQDELTRKLSGATIDPIGAIYIHSIFNEDLCIQQIVQGKQPLVYKDGWLDRFGLQHPPAGEGPDWKNAKLDVALFKEYARIAQKATDDYLSSINDQELGRKIDFFGRREETIGWVIADMILMHHAGHGGEIAALKGVMGKQGLPY